jgi:hypothetical protein
MKLTISLKIKQDISYLKRILVIAVQGLILIDRLSKDVFIKVNNNEYKQIIIRSKVGIN